MELNPGDIVEIETPGGLAYAQVTHNHASYPEVVRVLSGLHDSRPSDLETLARSMSHFTAMLPLGAAIERKRVSGTRIGAAAIPEEHEAFPIFRMPIHDKQGRVAYWWLWDGEGLRYETELDADTTDLPIREVMPVDAFMQRLG